MATREVEFGVKVGVGVEGAESLSGLADRLDDVSKVLDKELAAKAQAAAKRLRELGEQDAAITDFERLKLGAADAARALKQAEQEAAAYGTRIIRFGPPTAEAATHLQRLQGAAAEAKSKVDQQGQALEAARDKLQRYGISSDHVRAAQDRLQKEIVEVRQSVAEIAPAYQGAARGAQNATASMGRSHRQVSEGVQSISQQLSRLQALYATIATAGGLSTVLREISQTADAFSNLQARVGLVTGRGAEFTHAWEGVVDVARRTSSELETTATLFTRIAQAGRDAGLGVREAAEQSLALTQTINQATQLSGGSAESANAAITQLIQGLQSGVLRGEEFNSVMEQAPRLAQALAAGLNVTTGELRKMANEGQITTDVVISALQSQSETLQREFAQLPATIGRALQNLSTQWSLYIGEADAASGASAAAARAIALLGENLATVADTLFAVGKAWLAFKALRLAQEFTGIGLAAAKATGAVVAQTAATAANTTATAANSAATTANAAAKNAAAAATTGLASASASLAAQSRTAASESASAAASAGRFAAILSSVKTFGLAAVVANYQEIGTWIGQATARLVGYRDRSDEIARAEKEAADIAKGTAADRARLVALTKNAVEAQFELSRAAAGAVAEFGNLTKEGANAAEAVKKISDGFDLDKVQGVKDFSATLDKLASDGALSATEFQAAWAQALSGRDLAQFEVMARAAFSGARREGERLAQVMDAVLSEAVRRTGLDFDNLRGQIGTASRGALNDVEAIVGGLDRLQAQGVDTGRVLSASFAKAINTADSQAAIDAVHSRIESLRTVLGDRVTDGLLDQAATKARDLRQALEDATPGINSVAEAMRRLGVTSDATLKETAGQAKAAYDALTTSGTASARELTAGFRVAAESAIAAGNGVAPAWVKAQAAARGYALEADAAGKTTLRAMVDASAAAQQAGDAARQAAGGYTALGDASVRASEQAVAAMERQVTAQERLNAAQERSAELERKRLNVDKVGFSTDKGGQRIAMGGDLTSLTGIAAFLKAAGIDNESIARQIAVQFSDGKGNIPYIDNPGQMRYGGRGSTLSSALLRAAEQYTFAGVEAGSGGQGTVPTPSRDVNVNISFEGQSIGRINTDAAGETVVRDLLARLQAAKGTSR